MIILIMHRLMCWMKIAGLDLLIMGLIQGTNLFHSIIVLDFNLYILLESVLLFNTGNYMCSFSLVFFFFFLVSSIFDI